MNVAKKKTTELETAATNVTDENFETEVLKFKGLVLLDIHAKWCGPCRILGPRIEELAEANTNPNVKIAKLDAGGHGDPMSVVAKELKIRAIPTVIVFKDGEEVERMTGAQEQWRLAKAIADNL